MQLLVSVRDSGEARAALAGGADLIDAKDPDAGALGPVSLETFDTIVSAVARAVPVTAALGDAGDESDIERHCAVFTRAGAALVKIGFAGVDDERRLAPLLAAAIRGAGRSRVIAVAYADATSAGAPAPEDVMAAAARAQIAGILIDTVDKSGPGLTTLMPGDTLTRWVASARRAGLLCAVAGKLSGGDLHAVQHAGADVAGVRGAACDAGRLGHITVERVRILRQECGRTGAPARSASVLQAR